MAVNAELLVKQWLEQDPTLADWPVSFDVPAESTASNPIRCITIEQTGGQFGFLRNMPLIAVQVWGRSRWDASDAANRLVLPRLRRMTELSDVAAVDITGMTNMPMSDGRPRYQILVQPTVTDTDIAGS